MISLALKYRPKSFSDLTEQSSIKLILEEQLRTKTTKNAYLFVGGAGTGKTTSARIFANEINQGKGTPIEIDAASNNGVEDARNIIENAKFKALDAEYKVYIIDECHMLSNGAWNAMLKLLEEPPAQTIFILCTTDPQKIPNTILSRVQRYDFQRISHNGIVKRLKYIIASENAELQYDENGNFIDEEYYLIDNDCYEYIAKLADGGMRDAITLLDKCLSFSAELNIEKVVEALGVTNFDDMFTLVDHIWNCNKEGIIHIIEGVHRKGIDLKQFIKQFTYFLVDLLKYELCQNYEYLQIPSNYEISYDKDQYEIIHDLLKVVISLNASIKWEQNPKPLIEAELLIF